MNISGPAAVAKPEMLFYAPGDLTVTAKQMLNDILKEVEIGIDFDAELFEQTVDSITVDSNELLTFHLAGGISLPEKIREKGRCYQA